jgi:hypothetical protein
MKMTERSLVKPSMTLLISPSTHGIRCPKKGKTSARVSFDSITFLGLLEKNRHKRPSLEEVLNHPWFGEFKDIHNMRSLADGESKFQAYTLTEPNSPKIKEEIDKYTYNQQ